MIRLSRPMLMLARRPLATGSKSKVPAATTTTPADQTAPDKVEPSTDVSTVPGKVGILTTITHDQMEALNDRFVRISRPSKNVMQSGTAYTNTWKIDFNTQERFEYWLMGWTGSSDPFSNLSLNFPTKEEAIAYCERNQLPWYVEEQPERKFRKKSYADNFSWNKRTRLGSK